MSEFDLSMYRACHVHFGQ